MPVGIVSQFSGSEARKTSNEPTSCKTTILYLIIQIIVRIDISLTNIETSHMMRPSPS